MCESQLACTSNLTNGEKSSIRLVEMNMAENAEAHHEGRHPGYEPFALAGLSESLDLIAQKGVKVITNGGSLNPQGLADKCRMMVIYNKSSFAILCVY